MVETRIITTAEPDQPAFAPAGADARLVVTLGLDVRDAGATPTDAEQDAAKAQFRTFLDALPGAGLYAYFVKTAPTPGTPGVLKLDTTFKADGVDGKLEALPAAGGLADNIINWIDRQVELYKAELAADPQHAPTTSQHCRGWVTTSGPEEVGELDARQLSATHLLLAAQGWDAPSPQQSGLVRTVIVGAANTKQLIIVPWFAGTAAADEIELVAAVEGVGRFTYTPFKNFTVTSIARPVQDAPAVDTTSLVDPASGFVQNRDNAAELHRTLRRIADQSATMLSAFPHLAGYAGIVAAASPPLEDDVRRAIYFGVMGLSVLVDPLLVGFTAAHESREGPFVAALATEVDTRIVGLTNLGKLAGAITSKLKDRLSGAKPEDLAKLLLAVTGIGSLPAKDKSEESETLLPALLRHYVDGKVSFSEDFQKRLANALMLQTSVELAAAGQAFQTEEGMEKGALALLRELSIDAGFICTALGLDPDQDDNRQHCADALAAFTASLADSINGADAGRFALGDAYSRRLVKKVTDLTAAGLQAQLGATNWFRERLGLAPIEPVLGDDLLSYLATPQWDQPTLTAVETTTTDNLDNTEPVLLLDMLGQRFGDVVLELIPVPAAGRFIPDQAPPPLPIVIAIDPDTGDQDTFDQTYDGLALLVRRKGGLWAHANVARLETYREFKAGADVYEPVPRNSIHPLMPVASDGQRALFVSYEGLSLASSAFDGTMLPDNATDGRFVPFQRVDAPGKTQRGAFAKLPALYYGTAYEVAAFALGRGGALPAALQAETKAPWWPAPAVADPPFIDKHDYRRTTAVGRITISDESTATLRIGKAIEGVQPLFRDYPRTGLTTGGQTQQQLDICRNPDGTGTISLPAAKDETVTFALSELWSWGAAGTLTVELHQSATAKFDADPVASRDFPLAASIVGAITLTATRLDEPDIADARVKVSVASSAQPDAGKEVTLSAKSVWLRLKLTRPKDSKELALSFADPSAGATGDHTTALPGADSLLLLAPSGIEREWLSPHADPVAGIIELPRVGFLDFDRWVGDIDPKTATLKQKGTVPFGDLGKLRTALMTAYLARSIDERLGPLVDALPDPAVTRLLVELTPLDTLASEPKAGLAASADGLVKEIELGAMDAGLSFDEEKLIGDLKKLAARHTATLSVTSKPGPLSLTVATAKEGRQCSIEINVPRGMVARLSVRPMVRQNLVGPVFDQRIDTLARRVCGDHLVFDGTALVVESMLGAPAVELLSKVKQSWQEELDQYGRSAVWEALAQKVVDVVSAGRQRQYSLAATPPADPTEAWRWRMLGSVDVQTQRWRFGGRPIYSWLDPRGGGGSVAVRQKISDALARFEDEAFFDRDDKDVDVQTTRLDPAPAATVLQQFPWEPPSATFFRHRISVRSRYAGALHPAARSVVRAWGDDKAGAADAWIRVAMLADRTRLQLTRPQLRALLPLTTSPRLAETEPFAATPPVLAVLDERPFVHGGLAERIGAEIKTSIGYDLPNDLLSVTDTRKQIGPDPRLSYSPTDDEDALSVTLRPEGPVGLTFDDDSIRAPAFANTAIVLTPELLRDKPARPGSLEEHFLSVGLRRYLDHRWLLPEPVKASECPPAETWWAETVGGGNLTLAARTRKELEDKAPGSPICKVTVDGQNWVVTVPAGVLLPGYVPPQGKPSDITIAKLAKSKATGIALQHLPLEEGRASLAVFAVQDGTARGASGVGQTNQPLMMASVEWVVPSETAVLDFSGGTVHATSASPTTLMNWTRTGTAFDALRHRPGSMAELEAIDAAGIEVRLDKKTDPKAPDTWRFVRRSTGTPLNPEPSKFDYPHPLYVHRHQAVIGTRLAAGLGRPLDVFDNAVRLFPGSFTLGRDTRSVRLVEFEMPARPLAGNLPSWDGMASVRTVRFDLYSIFGERFSADQSKAPTGFSLYLRLVGDTRTKLTNLDLKLSLHPRGADKTTDIQLTLQRKAADKDVMWRALRLDVTAAGGLAGRAIRSDGTDDLPPTANPKLTTFKMAELDYVELTVNSATTAGEFWCDVSLLSLASGGTAQGFDFGWFFTGTGLAPGEAVSAASLRMMTEAQARIIAVSPPMPVVATK